jgi:hypothetical protein
MNFINYSYIFVVALIVCAVSLKWDTNKIERIVNIEKTQTNQMNSTNCCEQKKRIVCSNTIN